ncbi:1587_t:CDS:2, partial [Gigaspora rosea]
LVNCDEVCGMNEKFKYLPKPDKEVNREIEHCDEVRKNGGVVIRKVPLAIVMRMETLNNHVEGVKDQLEDTGVEYVNMKNDKKSIIV